MKLQEFVPAANSQPSQFLQREKSLEEELYRIVIIAGVETDTVPTAGVTFDALRLALLCPFYLERCLDIRERKGVFSLFRFYEVPFLVKLIVQGILKKGRETPPAFKSSAREVIG